MVSPTVSFSGIASGLDTNTLVDTLMSVERAPITRMQIRRNEYDQKLNSWTAINTKVSELRNTVDDLQSTSEFANFVKASSSNTDAVSVSVTGTPATASLSINVTQLASNHQVSTGSGFTSSDALVGTGDFSITTSTGSVDVAADSSTTLEGLAQQINSANGGLTASVIEVGLNDYRLLLTSADSGSDSQFTVTSNLGGFASSDVVAAGADATIRLGDPVTGLEITRSSNTFEDVIEGVKIEAKQITASPATVAIVRDTESAATAITSMVNATNSLLSELENQTSYNAESDTASPLTNDRTARDMVISLRNSMSEVVANSGSFNTIIDIGIEFERDGSYSIDESKLTDALTTDFDSVISLFARGGSSDSGQVGYVSATSATQPGTYEVVVDTAASIPELEGSMFESPANLEEFNIQYGGINALVTVSKNATLLQAIDSISSDLASYGLTDVLVGSVAVTGGDALHVSVPDAYGSVHELAIWNDGEFGLNGISSGADVTGTIGGQAASGSGRTLTGTAGNSEGLSVQVTATSGDVGGGNYTAGSVTISQGLGGRLDAWLDSFEGIDGEISRARSEWDTRISSIDDSIATMEERMSLRETQLRREFTAMETALARLQAQGNYLSGVLPPTTSG
ncbi:MAG: flagellar filament capping protein FliD [Actinomycetia bacterium]|nr:flagellar filament capping protein FliD [Actinomycetes bacterium]MCP4960874.1 flagellar filament capping protein FliD [Actinomycetes bacterium]